MSHQPNNIFAGTQVVSLVEVRGTNHSLVHPCGAVGVVTRTPAVEGEHFLVRFPDGLEKSLERSQIEVLKHFKDRLGVAADVTRRNLFEIGGENQRGLTSAATESGFDLEFFIIYRCVVGSRAYGLDNDESDTDRRGIHLMRTGEVEANLVTLNGEFRLPYIADLVARKLAGPEKSKLEDADIAFHESEYLRLRAELQAAHDTSTLPELPSDETRAALNDLLVRARLKASLSGAL